MKKRCLHIGSMGKGFRARVYILASVFWCVLALAPGLTHAQVIGPADAGRIEQRIEPLETRPTLAAPKAPISVMPSERAPEGSAKIAFVLRGVRFENLHAFSDHEVRDLYAPYLDKEITLDVVWMIAGRLTERYQAAGYFLSRAYVPQQEIEDGFVRIRVVEGYVDEIGLDDKLKGNALVVEWLDRLREEKPLKVSSLESMLLRLNDLPGVEVRSVLEQPAGDAPEGAVKLNMVSLHEKDVARISFDNFGSRYLGPYEFTGQYSTSLIENQRTSVSLLGAKQLEELRYGSIRHEMPVMFGGMVDVSAGRTITQPGYTLKRQGIESVSDSFGVGFAYQWIRQRDENFNTRIAFDSRDTSSDIFDGLLEITRDHVRAFRASADYQVSDGWNGYNSMTATLSQGTSLFGASEAGSRNLSRAEARPDFTKLELGYTRLQQITSQWGALGSVNGQIASGPLYSSEEFGYGGQAFGRAYDSSEITGDHGIAASLEIRYNGLPSWVGISFAPYGFYDIGSIWNDDAGQEQQASGSSTGLGMRVASELGITANLGMALPLTRAVAAPLDGNGKNPRYVLQLSYDF